MEVLYRNCCGVDVHKKFLVACLLVMDESGQSHKEARRFSTMTGDLLACIDWLEQAHCTAIAMESTGVYWHAPHNLMEGRFEQVIVVNAEHLKRVPGHKTDQKDAEWIAELLQVGLLKPSFIPPRSQRELRHLTRLRTTLTQERTRFINRLQKVLEHANLKLSSVLSDVMGQTSRQILGAIVAGEDNPDLLADFALRRVPNKREQLVLALSGQISDHHRLLLRELLALIQQHEQAISRLDQDIAERLQGLGEKIERLDAIPGLKRRSIEVLFAEVGWDMSPFPDAAHLASLVGICPGNYETGGKRLKGRTRKGNRYVKAILVQAAHGVATTQTYLGAQDRRLAARRGSKRAAVAVGHSILIIYYHMLKTGEPYQEKGANYFSQLERNATQRRLTKQLERLGYQVTLTPATFA
jgi:transposase